MSATTVELNAGSGGAKELHDSLTTVNGGAAPAGAVAQVVKLAFGEASDAQMVSNADPMPVTGPLTLAQLVAAVLATTNTPVTPTQTFTNSAATTNATLTKGSAGTVWSIVVTNTNAATRYLKLYNKATAPTVGTDVPVLTIPVAAGATVQIDGGSNGIRFGTGIGWALTGAAGDADATAVTAADTKVAIAYT